MKKCTKCGTVKDREEGFHRDRQARDGRRSVCKTCASEANRAFRTENPTYASEWYQQHREEIADVAREWSARHRDARRLIATRFRLKQYGLSIEDFERILVAQGGLCALCQQPLDLTTVRATAVDHDHSCCSDKPYCGACTRGIVCRPCNIGLGGFRDSEQFLLLAIDYLRRHR